MVTSPGPTPGVAWTTAMTPRSPPATARSAAPRLRRSRLTEKPRLALSFGTFRVASAVTETVRSTAAPALAGTSRASASRAVRIMVRVREVIVPPRL